MMLSKAVSLSLTSYAFHLILSISAIYEKIMHHLRQFYDFKMVIAPGRKVRTKVVLSR